MACFHSEKHKKQDHIIFMFNYEELSLEVDWKITWAIFQIRANHDPERVTAFLSPFKGRVMGKYDRKRERVTRMFFLTIFKQEVYPKSYKDSPRGLTSSIRTFHYRSKRVKRAYKSQRINMLTGSTNVHLFRYMKSVRI